MALARFLPCSAGDLLLSFSRGSPEATQQHFVFVSGKPVTHAALSCWFPALVIQPIRPQVPTDATSSWTMAVTRPF